MNAYEKARDLILKIESHRVKIDSHQQSIGQLQGELQLALKEADLKAGEVAGAPPAKGKASGRSAASAVKRSHKRQVVVPVKPAVAAAKPVAATSKRAVAPTKTAAGKPAKNKTSKAGSSKNGQKSQRPADKPTLGDLVRTVIIKAGRPLKRLEIQAGLKRLKYSNSSPNPYKTLGVRLHRLQSRGVVSVGDGRFDVSADWKRQNERLVEGAAKKTVKEAAPAEPETAAA
jgi:hypothetical protein